MFWSTRPEQKGAIGNVIYDLLTLDLTASEASELGVRIEVIADEYGTIQDEQAKANIEEMKRKGRS